MFVSLYTIKINKENKNADRGYNRPRQFDVVLPHQNQIMEISLRIPLKYS